MTIIYRTAGAWGAGKGSNLTPDEVDENFYDHEQRIAEMEENPPSPVEISNITQAGNTITVHMSDGSTFGPFNLPRPVQRPTETLAVSASTLTPAVEQSMFYFRCSDAIGCEVTIPNNSAEAFLVDTEIHFRQVGAGPISFVADTGVTLNGVDGYLNETAGPGAVVTAKKVGTNEWDLFGLLAVETTS
ncbi:hypothetical protein [Sinorhizobium americanum]|uniref:Uncharacterized protein n=1 Tax=Sinorhizobium americanum TaxID=194963 RepID=A0A4R2BTZ6_9HYPH|nr:hypothetical protein [Sinorhizobium americanum]TCN30352.1 hypothetical protein EV184_108226 [Sinorhizobium americanum]